jgi:hypothetical protein
LNSRLIIGCRLIRGTFSWDFFKIKDNIII